MDTPKNAASASRFAMQGIAWALRQKDTAVFETDTAEHISAGVICLTSIR